MKKLFSLFVLILIFTTKSFAQYDIENIKISYGVELPDDKAKIVKIFGEHNNKIFALALKGKKDFYIKTFSSGDMKLLSNKLIILPELKDKDLEFEEVVLLDGKPYIIGSVYHRKNKVFTLLGIALGEDGKLEKNMITLFESEVAKSNGRGGFYFKLSPDEKNILIMHTALFEKEDAMKYEIKLFDSNLAQKFSKY